MTQSRVNLLDYDRQGLRDLFAQLGEKPYRGSTQSVRTARDQNDLAAKTGWSDRFVQRAHSASCLISAYRSDLPSKPMPGSSGIVM